MENEKNGKAIGQDDIPVEAWKWLREITVGPLTRIFNISKAKKCQRMEEKVLISIFNNKGDVQSCNNYRH